jgi:precorrin-4/cobalt-precorrin-4 C11-methyltransferase
MVTFVSAGPGDPELITLKGYNALREADIVLYTGSLVPKEILGWCKEEAIIKSSQNMSYDDIFDFFIQHKESNFVRLHTGDVTLYSTLAKQIDFLRRSGIEYRIIPGVSAIFGAGASLEIEYTITGVSQSVIISRVEGKTPNPEPLENILRCKNSSLVFYLSINLINKLKKEALALGYSPQTPCWVIEKATWPDEKIYKGSLETISSKVSHIKGVALILLGDFLKQKETLESHLYSKSFKG